MDRIEISANLLIHDETEWQKRGLSQTASGYGAKLMTRWKVMHKGKFRRIYAINYGNSGSTFIILDKKRVFVDVIGTPLAC